MDWLFGRQKPVHNLLFGLVAADVLLWRNKKISASILTGSITIWILFEWVSYHFLSHIFISLIIGMVAQFLWSNVHADLMNRSPSQVLHIVLPDKLFVNIAITIGAKVNFFLALLQNVASGGNLKQFLVDVLSLLVAAVIGSWYNFLTILYITKRSIFFYLYGVGFI
ncbi:hypothetical protein GIB67_014516 [Kingdonia uniflora]|uniref:Reticulon-like protein n=1 Tax=Kingdonia uniflora TaxID=39325 RepID=A0A7J7NM21_9MAGN|nr:hypothetical protein GIB67_014516 [Kingdonia uniflora]